METQKYYAREKNGRIKKGGYKNGRGYCGYYTNKDGKKMFLRSSLEFMYAVYLDHMCKHFLTEQMTFEITGIYYKPDFFIYDEQYGKLLEIVEIKHDEQAAQPYLPFINFFKDIGIKYSIEYDKKVYAKYTTKSMLEKWKQDFVENYKSINVIGENNPMFGMKHSKETKRKIGNQTKRYMKDPDIKRRHSQSIRSFWKSPEAESIKEKYRVLRHQEKAARDAKNPIVERKCAFCNKEFQCRKNDNKLTCSNSCSQKRNWETGKVTYKGNAQKSYKTKMIKTLCNHADRLHFDDRYDLDIKVLKGENLIPLHLGLGSHVVKKYFGSLDKFKKEIQKWQN